MMEKNIKMAEKAIEQISKVMDKRETLTCPGT